MAPADDRDGLHEGLIVSPREGRCRFGAAPSCVQGRLPAHALDWAAADRGGRRERDRHGHRRTRRGPEPAHGRAAASAGIVAVDFVLMLLVCAGTLIAGYYGWRGYAWARWAGVVALGVSLLALLLHPVAWAVPALAALGAGALWLPVSRRW